MFFCLPQELKGLDEEAFFVFISLDEFEDVGMSAVEEDFNLLPRPQLLYGSFTVEDVNIFVLAQSDVTTVSDDVTEVFDESLSSIN